MSISATLPPATVKASTENTRPSGRRVSTPALPFTSTTSLDSPSFEKAAACDATASCS